MLLYLLSQQFLKALQNKSDKQLEVQYCNTFTKVTSPQSTKSTNTKVQVFKLLFHKNYL